MYSYGQHFCILKDYSFKKRSNQSVPYVMKAVWCGEPKLYTPIHAKYSLATSMEFTASYGQYHSPSQHPLFFIMNSAF